MHVIRNSPYVRRRDTPMDDLTIHLGDYDLTADNETEHQVRKVSRVMFHSHFHPFLLDNDIALLRLDRPVVATKTVRPVCLPSAAGKYSARTARQTAHTHASRCTPNGIVSFNHGCGASSKAFKKKVSLARRNANVRSVRELCSWYHESSGRVSFGIRSR